MTDLEKRILNLLPADGSTRSNASIMNELDCSWEDYQEAKVALQGNKHIISGRGYSGTIRASGNTRLIQLSTKLLQKLKDEAPTGAAVGNKRMRELLEITGGDEPLYWQARDILMAEGKIENGRGNGGSIYLSALEQVMPAQIQPISSTSERALMTPIESVLKEAWSLYKSYGETSTVINTSCQGRRSTGGKWSRPDFTICTFKNYTYTRSELELTSFELKANSGIDESCIYEVLSHKKCVHYAYILLEKKETNDAVSQQTWDSIYADAQKYGLGMITFLDPSDFDTWTIWIDPIRNNPLPHDLDGFVNTQISAVEKEILQKWIES